MKKLEKRERREGVDSVLTRSRTRPLLQKLSSQSSTRRSVTLRLESPKHATRCPRPGPAQGWVNRKSPGDRRGDNSSSA